jgi:hypothetical protein
MVGELASRLPGPHRPAHEYLLIERGTNEQKRFDAGNPARSIPAS